MAWGALQRGVLPLCCAQHRQEVRGGEHRMTAHELRPESNSSAPGSRLEGGPSSMPPGGARHLLGWVLDLTVLALVSALARSTHGYC